MNTPGRMIAALVASAVLLAGCTGALPPDPSDPGPAGATASPRTPTLSEVAPGLHTAQPTFVAPASPGERPGAPLVLTIAEEPGPGRFGPGNIGLSFEATELADRRWEPGDTALTQLIASLGGSSLRFGGNSVDRRFWWTSAGEPAPEWAEATVTPADLERLARFARAADATVTLSVDLGHNDPQRAADLVDHAYRALGERLVGVSLGNEPNAYARPEAPRLRMRPNGWGPEAYLEQVRSYEQAIHARVPEAALIGPNAYEEPWWTAFVEADLPGTAALTQHWYALWACGESGDAYARPTVGNLVSATAHQRARQVIERTVRLAASHGLPLWMEETGPTSCGGLNATSRTHAQALWTADYVLLGASLGVRRMNHHGTLRTCRYGAPMSAVCTDGRAGDPKIIGQANYLALLQLAQLRHGEMLPAHVAGSDTAFGYAIRDADGLDVVVVNLTEPDVVGASALQVEMPAGYTITHASVLSAPRLGVRQGSALVPWSPVTEVPAEVGAGSVLALRFVRD